MTSGNGMLHVLREFIWLVRSLFLLVGIIWILYKAICLAHGYVDNLHTNVPWWCVHLDNTLVWTDDNTSQRGILYGVPLTGFTWWSRCMERIPRYRLLWGESSGDHQWAFNLELWRFLVGCWTNSRVVGDLWHHDIHVIVIVMMTEMHVISTSCYKATFVKFNNSIDISPP